MSQTSLENDNILVAVHSTGAELKSLWLKSRKQELLWQGNPEFWSRTAPWLFPIVGKLKENTYRIDSKNFHLPQHGFARDCIFRLEALSQQEAAFSLSSNSETLNNYPFQFQLNIKYQLEKDGLGIVFEIENPDRSLSLPCSYGMHPGFNLFGPTKIRFQNPETAFVGLTGEGLLTLDTRAELDQQNCLTATPGLFENGALILTQLKSSTIALQTGPLTIELELSNWSSFGIWSPRTNEHDLRFICLEPWNGYNDPLTHDSVFAHKPGICWVKPGQKLTSSIKIRLKEA